MKVVTATANQWIRFFARLQQMDRQPAELFVDLEQRSVRIDTRGRSIAG
jgi:hypothetical protein